MLAGLVIVPVISMITPKPDDALVEDALSSYSKKVLVQQTEALSDEEEN
jgi:SSS family solute:Na+ symporter